MASIPTIPRRGRLYVQRAGTWQVVDTHYSSVVDFSTRQEAEKAATFYRAYIRQHGNINLMSVPRNLNSPLAFPPSADPRFEEDTRFNAAGGYRNPPRAAYSQEVDAWFARHPEERALWLRHPLAEWSTQDPPP